MRRARDGALRTLGEPKFARAFTQGAGQTRDAVVARLREEIRSAGSAPEGPAGRTGR
jgi:hypothetical protein